MPPMAATCPHESGRFTIAYLPAKACFEDRGKEPVTVLPEGNVPIFGTSAQSGTRKGYQRFRYTFIGLLPTSSDPDEEPTWLQTLLCGLSVEFVICRTTVFFPKSQCNSSESFVTKGNCLLLHSKKSALAEKNTCIARRKYYFDCMPMVARACGRSQSRRRSCSKHRSRSRPRGQVAAQSVGTNKFGKNKDRICGRKVVCPAGRLEATTVRALCLARRSNAGGEEIHVVAEAANPTLPENWQP
jgi:hypothetical protein